MRRALALLALASCGPARVEELYPRYLVLTTIGPESPMHASVRWLAERRFAAVRSFRSLEADAADLLALLRAAAPSYVALVLRPEELDANGHLAFLEAACRVDDDPFPDFAFGYFLAPDPATLRRQMDALQTAEGRAEKRLFRATYADFGGAESDARTLAQRWATNLPLRVLTVKPGDRAFLEKNREDLERADLLLLSGDGAPDGLPGLSAADAARLRLDSTLVFSAASHTGAAGAVFDLDAGPARRRTIRPENSFLLALLRSGVPAAIAPLQQSHPGLVGEEWTHGLLSRAPFGEVVKHTYDLAVLAGGGALPSFPRFADGARPPDALRRMDALAFTRVLYGDPLLRMVTRDTTPPLEELSVAAAGSRRFRVQAEDCGPFFGDPFGGGEKIHLRLPLRGARRAAAALEGAWIGDQPHPLRLAAQALEEWRGETYLHLLLQGSGLAKKDLSFQIRVTAE